MAKNTLKCNHLMPLHFKGLRHGKMQANHAIMQIHDGQDTAVCINKEFLDLSLGTMCTERGYRGTHALNV